MAETEVMSTPINELASNEPINSENSEENISENIMKNYENFENSSSINNVGGMRIPENNDNDDSIDYEEEPSYSPKKKSNSVKKNSVRKSCSNMSSCLMYYLKPALIVFMIILVFSYPLFDTKILKLIPKTLNQYDNITIIGLIVKAILGSLLFVLGYKFI